MYLKRFLKCLLIACILFSVAGFLMVIFEMDFGLYLAFGSMAVGTFPAFYFASQVAFDRTKTGGPNSEPNEDDA
jgi:hypothetical protein